MANCCTNSVKPEIQNFALTPEKNKRKEEREEESNKFYPLDTTF